MLIVVALSSALLSGHGMALGKGRSWLHILAFSFLVSFSIYVILELEFPRAGWIRVDSADELLLGVRGLMQ